VVLVAHAALRMFATGAAWRIRATLFVILTAFRRISEPISSSKSGSAKKHGCGD